MDKRKAMQYTLNGLEMWDNFPDSNSSEMRDYYKTVAEIISYRMPMVMERSQYGYRCPVCGSYLGYYGEIYEKFCENCGQKVIKEN